MEEILQEIREERKHQDAKWGGPAHDDEHSMYVWVGFISYYLGQSLSSAIKEYGSVKHRYQIFRYHMVKVAAIAVAAVQSIDRKLSKEE